MMWKKYEGGIKRERGDERGVTREKGQEGEGGGRETRTNGNFECCDHFIRCSVAVAEGDTCCAPHCSNPCSSV